MQYSIASEIYGVPFHMEASYFQQYYPLARAAMSGLQYSKEGEPQESIPSFLNAKTGTPVAMSDDDQEPSREKVVYVLPVRGPMTKHDQECGPRGTRTLGNRLRRADTDQSVIGHVIIFETGGGSSISVPELSDAIQECKKPVLAFVDGIMCSAGIFAGSYCDEIWASRENDKVGSIGTMIVYQGRKSKSEEDQNKEVQITIYADEAFEKNEEWETAINDFDVKLTKERILNPHNEEFVQVMRTNFPNVKDEHLHGRTWPAKEVLGVFVNQIGRFEDAVMRVVELAEKQNKPPKDTQNTNFQNMKQFSFVNAALGIQSMESADEHVSLNEEQLEALDNSLAAASKVTSDLQAEQTAHGNTKQELATANETIQNLQGSSGADTPPPPKETDTKEESFATEDFGHVSSAQELFNNLPD